MWSQLLNRANAPLPEVVIFNLGYSFFFPPHVAVMFEMSSGTQYCTYLLRAWVTYTICL